MGNSATRNGSSFPLHLLRAAPVAADALSSVSYLKPYPEETRMPSFLVHLPVNDVLVCRNDSPTGPLLDWRRAEAAATGKKEEEEENHGKRTEDLDDVHVFSDDDSDSDRVRRSSCVQRC